MNVNAAICCGVTKSYNKPMAQLRNPGGMLIHVPNHGVNPVQVLENAVRIRCTAALRHPHIRKAHRNHNLLGGVAVGHASTWGRQNTSLNQTTGRNIPPMN